MDEILRKEQYARIYQNTFHRPEIELRYAGLPFTQGLWGGIFSKTFFKMIPRNLIERDIVQYEIHRIIIRKRFINKFERNV